MKAFKSIFTVDKEIQKSEIIQALNYVKSNYYFASANGDGKKFEAMFHDSEIAKGYKQNETKFKYTIQYGIFPNLKDLSLEHLKDPVLTFKFDESTTQPANKQCDGHVQCWSEKYKCIKIAYCETILVDYLLHCRKVARLFPLIF